MNFSTYAMQWIDLIMIIFLIIRSYWNAAVCYSCNNTYAVIHQHTTALGEAMPCKLKKSEETYRADRKT